MDRLILDFEGDCVEVPSAIVYLNAFSHKGLKVEHNKQVYEVIDHIVTGVDDVAEEFERWDKESQRSKVFTLTVKLVRV